MEQLKKSSHPRVTLHTTGSSNKAIIKCVHGKFYLEKNGELYGKNGGMDGYSSAKILERYL